MVLPAIIPSQPVDLPTNSIITGRFLAATLRATRNFLKQGSTMTFPDFNWALPCALPTQMCGTDCSCLKEDLKEMIHRVLQEAGNHRIFSEPSSITLPSPDFTLPEDMHGSCSKTNMTLSIHHQNFSSLLVDLPGILPTDGTQG